MIAREHRFHGRNSLRYVYRTGKTLRSPNLAIKYTHNAQQLKYRAAVVVSRKVSKQAVVRNRIRRRVYEVIRTHQTLINEPLDIVITVYSPVLALMPHDELEGLLVRQLQQMLPSQSWPQFMLLLI